MNWADRVSRDVDRWLVAAFIVCLLASLSIALWYMVTEVWRVSDTYCEVVFGERPLGALRWRGEGAYCVPRPLDSLALISFMTGILFLPILVSLVTPVFLVLAIFSTPHTAGSNRHRRPRTDHVED